MTTWSEHRQDRVIQRRRMAFLDVGTGTDACLLVHGLAASWRWWMDTIPALVPARRVVAVDLPGFGASEPAAEPSLDATVDALAALCTDLDLRRVDVVGHSMGTVIAQCLAQRAPELVERIVLTGGPILSVLRLLQDPVATLRRQPQVAAFLFEALTAGVPVPSRLQPLIAHHSWARRLAFAPYFARPDRLRPEVAAAIVNGAGAPGVRPTLAAGREVDPETLLAPSGHPVLLVGGAADPIAPPADLHEFARHVPAATVRILAGVGHSPMLEHPTTFNQTLTTFVAGTSAAVP